LRTQVARLVRRRSDITLRQLHILFECLDGSRAMRSLVGEGMDPASVSRSVRRLKSLGYLECARNGDDTRAVDVRLTPEGRRFVELAAQD